MAFLHFTQPFSLQGKSIVVPVVSTANVGQLAADVLIASLELTRVATLDPSYCVAVVGAREDGEAGITTPLELYARKDVPFVVLQQRSPVLKSRKDAFIAALLDFIRASGFSAALLLSGMDLLDRTDAQMQTAIYHLLPATTPAESLAHTPLAPLLALPIPAYTSPVRPPPPPPSVRTTPAPDPASDLPVIPGGGITRALLAALPPDWPVPAATLLHFVFEGDNRADAAHLAAVVARVLATDVQHWKQPASWANGLFGTPHDQTLYG